MPEEPANGERVFKTLAMGWPMFAGVVAVAFFAGRFSSTGDTEIASLKAGQVYLQEQIDAHTKTDQELAAQVESARAERFAQLNEANGKISFNDGRIEAIIKQLDELDMRLRDMEKSGRK